MVRMNHLEVKSPLSERESSLILRLESEYIIRKLAPRPVSEERVLVSRQDMSDMAVEGANRRCGSKASK
jgi:hypothetical protein